MMIESSNTIVASKEFYRFLDTLSGSKYQPMTVEEERKYFARIKAGDKESFDRVVYSNLRYVAREAIDYAGKSQVDVEELYQAGCEALTKAVTQFKPESNVRFLSYAGRAIKNEMTDKVTAEFAKNEAFSSYDEPINEEGDTKAEKIYSDYDKSHENDIDRKELHKALVEICKELLDPRERFVVMHQFGILDSEKKMQVQEIAEELHLTPERVRQIKQSAFAKMRKDERLCSLLAA